MTGKKRSAAALELVRHAFGLSDAGSKILSVLPVSVSLDSSEKSVEVEVGVGGKFIAKVSFEDIQENVIHQGRLRKYLLSKIFSEIDDDLDKVEYANNLWNVPSIEDIIEIQRNSVVTDRVSGIVRRVNDGTNICLVGNSASGKSTTASQVAKALFKSNVFSVTWVDLSEPSRGAVDVVESLIKPRESKGEKHLIIIDDAQANPGEVGRIGALVELVGSACHIPIQYIVIGWDAATQLIRDAFPDSIFVTCQGDGVLRQLCDDICPTLSEDKIQEVSLLSEGDLLVARIILDRFAEMGLMPERDEVARCAFSISTDEHSLSEEEIRLLYQLSALSQLDIDIATGYASLIDGDSLKTLTVEVKCIRKTGSYLSVGHRSLAKMLLVNIVNTYPEYIEDLPSPGQIAVDYIRSASPQQIVATLERLDIAGLAQMDSDQHGTTFLARAWESLTILVNYLAKQCPYGSLA